MTQKDYCLGKRSLGFLLVFVLATKKGERIITVYGDDSYLFRIYTSIQGFEKCLPQNRQPLLLSL